MIQKPGWVLMSTVRGGMWTDRCAAPLELCVEWKTVCKSMMCEYLPADAGRRPYINHSGSTDSGTPDLVRSGVGRESDIRVLVWGQIARWRRQ